MSVLTVTLNIAIDQTINLERLVPGEVHRATSLRQNPGGKGVNVSSCLADWGVRSAATGFLGVDNASLFEALFAAKGIEDAFVRVHGASRVNIKVVDQAGTTDINLPGLVINQDALDSLEKNLDACCRERKLAILAGSLPQGCPEDVYRSLLSKLNKAGVRVILDASETPLVRALEGESLPYCLKPNTFELGQLAGRELHGLEDVLTEARALRSRGVALVVVSMGEEGALFLSSQGALLARGRVEDIASTVGAGDAMVAGLAAAIVEAEGAEADLERLARLGTAFSVGKLSLQGPNLPQRSVIENIAAAVEVKAC